jgi:hypothetical protein
VVSTAYTCSKHVRQKTFENVQVCCCHHLYGAQDVATQSGSCNAAAALEATALLHLTLRARLVSLLPVHGCNAYSWHATSIMRTTPPAPCQTPHSENASDVSARKSLLLLVRPVVAFALPEAVSAAPELRAVLRSRRVCPAMSMVLFSWQ